MPVKTHLGAKGRNMSKSNFYMDVLLVHSFLDVPITKNADGEFSSLIMNSIKNMVKLDPNDPVKDLGNAMAPSAIMGIFKSLDIPNWGYLVALILYVFKIDIIGALRSIYNTLMPIIQSGAMISEKQVKSAVSQSLSLIQPPTADVENKVVDQLKSQSHSFHKMQLMKLAIADKKIIRKNAGFFLESILPVIASVLEWIFIAILTSAGIYLGGKAIKHFFGGTTTSKETPVQTKFPQKASYTDHDFSTQDRSIEYRTSPAPKEEEPSNSRRIMSDAISKMLISFTNEIYDGLNEGQIKQLPSFRALVSTLLDFNHASLKERMLFIPVAFKSKKQLVDYFIKDLPK